MRGAVCSVYDNLALTMVVIMVIALTVKDQMKLGSEKVFTGSFHSTGSVFHVIHGLTIKKYYSCAFVDVDFDLKRPLSGNFLAKRKKNEDLAFSLEPSDKVAKNPETVIHSAL